MVTIKRSLKDLLGEDYIDAVCRASAFCTGKQEIALQKAAAEKVALFSEEDSKRLHSMIPYIGRSVTEPLSVLVNGASSQAFKDASHSFMAPLSGFGCFRVGEDGRLYLSAKSEHYHTSLGHCFPGYQLLETAMRIGILNATHNNSRGYITRKLERELVKWANGLTCESDIDADAADRRGKFLNRIINLSTGSLAAEAGIKLMLRNFYREEESSPEPGCFGTVPVFFVLGDYEGGAKANYHGTTFLDQLFREMWPDFYRKADKAELLKIVPVKINDVQDFKQKVNSFQGGKYEPAGFIHEIVMMNYGVILVSKEYLTSVYSICREKGIPVMCDEIQTGIWYPEVFAYRKYGLKPDIVVLGKGFSGGQYAASRVITTSTMDGLSQFGALVTNGQQELASLSFLISLEFVRTHGEFIESIGAYYHESLSTLAADHPKVLDGVDGLGHMAALRFKSVDTAEEFSKEMNKRCVDISVHTYKPSCPPSALTKLPLVTTREVVDALVEIMRSVLEDELK